MKILYRDDITNTVFGFEDRDEATWPIEWKGLQRSDYPYRPSAKDL